jgi:acyl carrier protein
LGGGTAAIRLAILQDGCYSVALASITFRLDGNSKATMSALSPSIEIRLRAILAEILPRQGVISRLGPDDPLRAAGIDSMRIMLLISAVQEHFEVTIQEDDLRDENFASLRAVAALISAKCNC